MRLIKRLLIFVLLALVFAYAILFSINNNEGAVLDLLFIQLPEQPLSVWVLLALVIGGLTGFLVSAVVLLQLRTKNALLQRQLDKHNRELDKLQSDDLKALQRPQS